MVSAGSFNAPANVCLQIRPIFIYKRSVRVKPEFDHFDQPMPAGKQSLRIGDGRMAAATRINDL